MIAVRLRYFFLWLLLLTSWHSFGQDFQTCVTENGRVSFVSEAPLEVIKAASASLKGAIDIKQQTFLFILENATFKGFNSPLQQEHFHENYMETKRYPQTTFKGKIIETLEWKNGQSQTVRAKGILDLHGVKQERIIQATLVYEADRCSLIAGFNVLLDDHAIRIPKVVSKKIAQEIRIEVDAVMLPHQVSPEKAGR